MMTVYFTPTESMPTYSGIDKGRKTPTPFACVEAGPVEVSNEKGNQLLADFPANFSTDGSPRSEVDTTEDEVEIVDEDGE